MKLKRIKINVKGFGPPFQPSQNQMHTFCFQMLKKISEKWPLLAQGENNIFFFVKLPQSGKTSLREAKRGKRGEQFSSNAKTKENFGAAQHKALPANTGKQFS